MRLYSLATATLTLLLGWQGDASADQVLTPKLHHLRLGKVPEWSDFPVEAEGADLTLHFKATKNAGEWALRWRQQDVKQTWRILLNGKEIGRLTIDENDQEACVPLPAETLLDGDNTLAIKQAGNVVDDIRVGAIVLIERPLTQALHEAQVEIAVIDAADKDKSPLPSRITVLNAAGALAALGAQSDMDHAVRTGVIYTAAGRAKFGLPAGDYTIYAGRGFAYGIDSVRVALKPGDSIKRTLAIRREVSTKGNVACDTHVHTFTYAGHGDSTLDERVITLAGEGIELPIATDHNVQVDYQATAVKHGVRRYFTPVVGNEVTTSVGHFNLFPLPAGGPVPDFKLKEWQPLFDNLEKSGAQLIILNHGRDLHSGFVPFGPERHLALSGERLDGWALRANAMELINSGAHKSDMMRLVNDWFGLLNRGLNLTPVGSSDSHDVSRYIVGQGRTYIRCQDNRPGAINVKEAIANFRAGRVSVSCGLLAEIIANQSSEALRVAIRVDGPSWVKADRVELYANGVKIKEAVFPPVATAGAKWVGAWEFPPFSHDVYLVAVASGPGVNELYWPIAKPYQPSSPVVNKRVMSITGAVWIDGDGDGKRSCAFDYARRLFDAAGGEVAKLLPGLAAYDEAVAIQAASLLQAKGVSANDPGVREAAKRAGPHVESGFQKFAEAWRECQIARSERKAK
jgi:hypothetical protein